MSFSKKHIEAWMEDQHAALAIFDVPPEDLPRIASCLGLYKDSRNNVLAHIARDLLGGKNWPSGEALQDYIAEQYRYYRSTEWLMSLRGI